MDKEIGGTTPLLHSSLGKPMELICEKKRQEVHLLSPAFVMSHFENPIPVYLLCDLEATF